MRDDRERLFDIQEAIERIEKYASGGLDAIRNDELIANWMVRHIQVIGEAGSKLSREFRSKHPEIPWEAITGMRNILVHQYFEIQFDRVWDVVTKDIPDLKEKLNEILKEPGK